MRFVVVLTITLLSGIAVLAAFVLVALQVSMWKHAKAPEVTWAQHALRFPAFQESASSEKGLKYRRAVLLAFLVLAGAVALAGYLYRRFESLIR